jgi:hypothetical protein
MKHEKWVDVNGVTVYETGRRSSKLGVNKVFLTRGELIATKVLLSGTVTKYGTTFIAPFKKIV